jgi:hypothetical protein
VYLVFHTQINFKISIQFEILELYGIAFQEKIAKFKYLETTLTNQNDIRDEIKNRLNSGNACYYSVQNILSSRLI